MISAPTASVADDLVDHRLVYAHGIAALVTVLLAIAFGIIISLQFFAPDLAGPWLSSSWGRLRYAHTQGIMLGWLGNAFLAFLYHAVPVLTGRQVTSAGTLDVWAMESRRSAARLDPGAVRCQSARGVG
jgi:cbb3-type cytochrome oxidase subunit 1